MAKDDITATPLLPAWFKTAGDFRDGLLVCIGLVYALGFMTWSLSALERNIGFLEALDAQYVVAGIIPTFPILLIFIFYRLLKASSFREYFRSVTIPLCLLLAILLVFLLLAVVVYSLFADDGYLQPGHQDIAGSVVKMVWYASCMLLALSLLRWLPNGSQKRYDDQFHYRKWLFYYGPIIGPTVKGTLIILIFLLYVFCNREYITKLFPAVSASLGGGEPRCASIDVEKEKLSETTVEALSRQAITNDKVLHIRKALVLYSSNRGVIFKLAADKGAHTFEVSQSAVSVLTWCSALD